MQIPISMEAVSSVRPVRLHSKVLLIVLLFACCTPPIEKAAYNLTVNGLEEGEWRKYHSNGMLMEQRFYTHGVKTGLMKTWWENGKLQSLVRFKNGEYDGTSFEWNRQGVMIRKMHYVMGYEEGEQRQWYDDGSVRSDYIIKDGRRYGLLGTKNCLNVKDSIDKY